MYTERRRPGFGRYDELLRARGRPEDIQLALPRCVAFYMGSLAPAAAMPSREIFPASKFGQFTGCRPSEVRRHPARGHLSRGAPPPPHLGSSDRPN